MKETSQFNVFHQFAGCFVPHGLLSMKHLSAGAKLCYALLAQQANMRGTTQLNLPLLAASVGESERAAVRYLVELEEARLVESSRGNVNKEDVRLTFPRHPWLTRNAGAAQPATANLLAQAAEETQPQLFAVESALPGATTDAQADSAKKSPPSSKPKRRKRWFGRPRSCHSLETCLKFVTYQKEVLGHDHIWNVTGLARHIHLSGEQDEEIDAFLAEQASDAA